MPFFAAQIWTGSEGKFLSLVQKSYKTMPARLIWPRRKLRIRRRGQWRDSLAPIFPSYIFIHADGVAPDLYRAMRSTPGFLRFLLANDNIVPLEQKDQDLLNHFLSFGEVVDKSMVTFDKDYRIRVISGPLKGLEGAIVKVDKRKKRAKVRLALYSDSFNVDFGFEVLEQIRAVPAVKPSITPSPPPKL
jgi:transcriptional antiterminator NusG